jgi:hypothetical protein
MDAVSHRPRWLRWLGRGWRRRLALTAAPLALAALVLTRMDTQVHMPVGARGVGQGSLPVVLVAGLGSDGTGFDDLARELVADGVPVLDLDPRRPGRQPLVYRPDERDDGIGEAAVRVVAPQIESAMARAGLDPATDRVDVVAHSMGGLLVRYLVEHPVPGWAERVDDLVMVATPNHGSDVIYWESRRDGPFNALGRDMRPGSAFLDALGYAEPPGEVYTAVGGDPWMFRWYRHGAHGFDDQVPSESPFLGGAALHTYPRLHGRLLDDPDVVDLVVSTLRAAQSGR